MAEAAPFPFGAGAIESGTCPTSRRAGLTHRLLIVDDEPLLREVYQTILGEALPCEILTANDGLEGLEIARSQRPDVILLDVHLPNMDGMTLLQRLHEELLLSQIQVIINTAMALDVETKVKAFDLGVTDYLFKSIDATELVARVQAAFTRKRVEETIRKEQESAARLEAVIQLIRRLHHEVNNPLHALLGLLDFDELYNGSEGERRECLDLIRQSAMEIAAFMRQLGEITTIETLMSPFGEMTRLPNDLSEG
jgi:DNA-binding response OmpR family regulator